VGKEKGDVWKIGIYSGLFLQYSEIKNEHFFMLAKGKRKHIWNLFWPVNIVYEAKKITVWSELTPRYEVQVVKKEGESQS